MLCDAVRQAMEAARPGDVVLLSPACASFDQFRDFEAAATPSAMSSPP
jgi:UDP-N-acetylmuramoylalanine--D-glutamate ligase